MNLAVDALTAEVSRCLETDKIDHILLKGPSIARWLYRKGERIYGDVDLLVRPGDLARVEAALTGRGFDQAATRVPFLEAPHALAWKRPGTPGAIDLHTRVPGCAAHPQAQADILFSLTAPLEVGGKAIPILVPVARALHIVLHAAHHGVRATKPREDLRRVLQEHRDATFWLHVRELADELDANQGLSAGLMMLDAGSDVHARLNLRPPSNPATVIQATERHVGPSLGLERLATAGGLKARLEILKGAVWPDATYMRSRYATARKGTLGLVLMRVVRSGVLLKRLIVSGIPSWLRVRRSLRGPAGRPRRTRRPRA